MTVSYQLPPLPYGYNALEPYIDEHTMKLHHDKHHLAYVGGLNHALEQLDAARGANDPALVKHWLREVAFHGSGHFLHSVFWPNMAPPSAGGGGEPGDVLMEQIARDFGSFDAFQTQFTDTALAVEGSGWALLAWEPVGGQLLVLQVEKHQTGALWGAVPLLVLDVWEHAYYLSYRNRRGSYVEAWWHVVNWPDVTERLLSAQR